MNKLFYVACQFMLVLHLPNVFIVLEKLLQHFYLRMSTLDINILYNGLKS